MDGALRPDDRHPESLCRQLPGHAGRHQGAERRAAHLDVRVQVVDEGAALAGAPTRRLREVAAEYRNRKRGGTRERVLDQAAAQPAIRDGLVELAHQLGLGERRHLGELLEADARGVQANEAA
jgi:hypothetical protein